MCAAALRSPVWRFSYACLFLSALVWHIFVDRCHNLINIGLKCILSVTTEFHDSHNILPGIARALGSPWLVVGLCKWQRQRRERKQKRGCRSGILVRLWRQPHRPPHPSLLLTNTRSAVSKRDDLELLLAAKGPAQNSCVMVTTETWLHPLISYVAVQLDGHSLRRSNRNRDSGKSRGGGLCIFVYEG